MDDPYKSTDAEVNEVSSAMMASGLSELSGLELYFESKESLLSCKSWVRFISVMGFILFCLTSLLLGVILTFSLRFFSHSTVGEGFPFSISLLFFIGLDVLVLMLAIRLSKYASAIKRFSLSQQSTDFDVVMHTQFKFWKIFAITILVSGAFLLFSIVGSYI